MARARPLTPDQQRAAQLIGRGFRHRTVAAEVGVSSKSIQRWLRRPDFAKLVEQGRRGALDAEPTAKATLEAALTATTKNGQPDWAIRVKAASLLFTGSIEEIETVRTERVYLGADDGAL